MTRSAGMIHPQLVPYARFYPRFSFSKKNIWLVHLLTRWVPAPRNVQGVPVENIRISGAQNQASLRLRIYKPRGQTTPTPALLWFHGGGYILGRPEQDDAACARFARELGITVISVDYRLAPRHPFPAALEDAYTALCWAAASSQDLGIDPDRIAVGGRSAGGGLAAALAQLAHNRREVSPVFQLLVYPMLDDRTVLRADLDDQRNVTWSRASNRFGWESYLGQSCGEEQAPIYAVPARRADLAGLPPAWIGVGSLDLFHDEDHAYANRLKGCGVICELEIITGAFHAFDVVGSHLPIVLEFQRSQLAALQKHLFC